MSIWTIPAPYETLGCFYHVSQRLHQVDTEFLMGERSGAGDLELHVFGADLHPAVLGKWFVCDAEHTKILGLLMDQQWDASQNN